MGHHIILISIHISSLKKCISVSKEHETFGIRGKTEESTLPENVLSIITCLEADEIQSYTSPSQGQTEMKCNCMSESDLST